MLQLAFIKIFFSFPRVCSACGLLRVENQNRAGKRDGKKCRWFVYLYTHKYTRAFNIGLRAMLPKSRFVPLCILFEKKNILVMFSFIITLCCTIVKLYIQLIRDVKTLFCSINWLVGKL